MSRDTDRCLIFVSECSAKSTLHSFPLPYYDRIVGFSMHTSQMTRVTNVSRAPVSARKFRPLLIVVGCVSRLSSAPVVRKNGLKEYLPSLSLVSPRKNETEVASPGDARSRLQRRTRSTRTSGSSRTGKAGMRRSLVRVICLTGTH